MVSERHEGIVDFFNETGAYGFIKSDTLDQDVFFHTADVGGPDLTEGEAVSFEVTQVAEGLRAEAIARKRDQTSASEAHSSDSMNDDRHTGTVDVYDGKGDFGFIESDTLREDSLEETIFFHMEDVGNPHLTEGSEVSFTVEYADRGPVARKVKLKSPQGGESTDTEVYTSRSNQSKSSDGVNTDETEMYEPDSTETTIANKESLEEDSPAFCPYCGTDLSEYPEGTFCPDCGEGL